MSCRLLCIMLYHVFSLSITVLFAALHYSHMSFDLLDMNLNLFSSLFFFFLVCLFLTPQHVSLWPGPSPLCPPGFCLWRKRRLAHKLLFSFRGLLTMLSASFTLYWTYLPTSGFLSTNQWLIKEWLIYKLSSLHLNTSNTFSCFF